jgi:hypothetical protein
VEERYSSIWVSASVALVASMGKGVLGETSQVTREAGVMATVSMDSAMLSSVEMIRSHSLRDWRFDLAHSVAPPAWRIALHGNI